MTAKGSPSMGKRQKRVHIACRRCGHVAYHVNKSQCAHCGFGKSPRMRHFGWRGKKIVGDKERKY